MGKNIKKTITTFDTINSPYTDYDISEHALLIFDWKG